MTATTERPGIDADLRDRARYNIDLARDASNIGDMKTLGRLAALAQAQATLALVEAVDRNTAALLDPVELAVTEDVEIAEPLAIESGSKGVTNVYVAPVGSSSATPSASPPTTTSPTPPRVRSRTRPWAVRSTTGRRRRISA